MGARYCIVNVDPERGVAGWVIGDSLDYLKSRAQGTHIPAALDGLTISRYRGIYDLEQGYFLLVEFGDATAGQSTDEFKLRELADQSDQWGMSNAKVQPYHLREAADEIEALKAALVTIEGWARDRRSGNPEITDVLGAIAERASRASKQ